MAANAGCDSSEKLTDQVRKWATSMNFKLATGSPMPTTKDFEYMCRGPMKDIFLFIVGHVQPVQTVNKVRGNVLHAQRQQQLRRGVASSMITSESQSIGPQLTSKFRADEKAVKEDLDKVLVAENKRDGLKDSFQFTLEKIEILGAFAKKADAEVDSMVNHEKKLESFINTSNQKSNSQAKKVVYVQRDVADGAFSILETTCMKNVRETCANHAIELLKSDVHLDGKSNLDQILNEQTTQDFRNAIENILANNSSANVLRCLTELSGTLSPVDQADLTPATSSEDITFGHNSMHMLPVFVKTIAMETEILLLKAELDDVMLQINNKLLKFFAANSEGTLDLAKKDIDKRFSEVEVKTKSSVFQRQAAQLQVDLQTWTERKKEIDRKRSLIADEETKVEKLKAVVTNLLRVLETRRATFDEQRRKLRDTLYSTFHDAKLKSGSEALRLLYNRTADNASAFLSNVPLDLMTSVKLQSVAQHKQQNIFSFAHELSSLPSHATIHERLPDSWETLAAKESMRRQMTFLSYLDVTLAVMNADYGQRSLIDLAKSVTQTKNRKIEQLLPQVSEFCDESTKLEFRSEAVKQSVLIWWEQPAQKIELQLKVDGTTLSTFMNELGRPAGHHTHLDCESSSIV